MDVNKNHQAEVNALNSNELQWHARHKRTAYSVSGTTDTLTAAKIPVVYIKNTSSDKDLIIYSVVAQTAAEAATLGVVTIYWSQDLGLTCTGGTAAVPLNLNTGSIKPAEATCLHSTPTLSVAGSEIGRIYAKANSEIISIDNGQAVTLSPGGSWSINYTTTGTAGVATAAVYFYLRDIVD
tara:strand:- start:508 stop:1050 length:543 start_codon:yes stop_codon:yes gene_type:complete